MQARFVAVMAASAALLGLNGNASAQSYPAKPVKILSTIPLGGSGDVAIRMAAIKMAESMGQAMVIETNGAGGGLVAARIVLKAAPDGYTLLHSSSGALASSVYLSKDLGYDPARDFAHISLVSYAPSLLVVNAGLPVTTFKELVDYAKRNPGKLSFASNGVGS